MCSRPSQVHLRRGGSDSGRLHSGGRCAGVRRTGCRSECATSFDLGGRFLMPGMIDAHIHPIGTKECGGWWPLYPVQAKLLDTGRSLPNLVSFVGKTVEIASQPDGRHTGHRQRARHRLLVSTGRNRHGVEWLGNFANVPYHPFLDRMPPHGLGQQESPRARPGINAAYVHKLRRRRSGLLLRF